ncbi:MAG: hypothetical protein JJU02_01765 [Cryomorphaceae bacterium]|nr:hypothetical protein [Cryomorphaceae bacterium]
MERLDFIKKGALATLSLGISPMMASAKSKQSNNGLKRAAFCIDKSLPNNKKYEMDLKFCIGLSENNWHRATDADKHLEFEMAIVDTNTNEEKVIRATYIVQSVKESASKNKSGQPEITTFQAKLNSLTIREFAPPKELDITQLIFQVDRTRDDEEYIYVNVLDNNSQVFMTGLECLKSEIDELDFLDDCFLTTACVHHMNKTDDSYELTTLRNFRDTHLTSNPEGKELVKAYYEIAPKIVESINAQPNKDAIYDGIYSGMILKTIDEIENGNFTQAIDVYKNYTYNLKRLLL